MSEEKKICWEDDAGNQLSGTYTVIGGMLTVTGPDGRQRRTQLGSMSAQTVAKILLRDLANRKHI